MAMKTGQKIGLGLAAVFAADICTPLNLFDKHPDTCLVDEWCSGEPSGQGPTASGDHEARNDIAPDIVTELRIGTLTIRCTGLIEQDLTSSGVDAMTATIPTTGFEWGSGGPSQNQVNPANARQVFTDRNGLIADFSRMLSGMYNTAAHCARL